MSLRCAGSDRRDRIRRTARLWRSPQCGVGLIVSLAALRGAFRFMRIAPRSGPFFGSRRERSQQISGARKRIAERCSALELGRDVRALSGEFP